MKIGNTSVLGLYKYNEELQFERGDLVVEDGIIYVVDKDVCGKKPSDDSVHEYYAIYLGEDILQPSEFDKDEAAHKFVTARVLKEVLSNYMYNSKTCIKDIYTGTVDGEGDVITYDLDGTEITLVKDITLDDFFDKFKSGIWQLNGGQCILRQSVFSISDPVQELFYPSKGILRYRTKSNREWKEFKATKPGTASTIKLLDDDCYYYQEDSLTLSSGKYISGKSDYVSDSIVNILLMKTENGVTVIKNIVTPLSTTGYTFSECGVKLLSNGKVEVTSSDWTPKELSRRIYYVSPQINND